MRQYLYTLMKLYAYHSERHNNAVNAMFTWDEDLNTPEEYRENDIIRKDSLGQMCSIHAQFIFEQPDEKPEPNKYVNELLKPILDDYRGTNEKYI